jgi:hypothetical protein
MSRTTRTINLRQGGAAVFTALAVALRWLLDPWQGDSFPFPTLFGAVALAVWLGGYRADQHAAPLLEAFLESPEVGLAAAEALRAIRSR